MMREKAQLVLAECQQAGLPLRIFEAWRSPERQRYLYAQGRTRPGNIITYARGWESYHQYGLAADYVGYVNGSWTWSLPDATWNKLHQIGASHGLERLGFETPHLQVADLDIGVLMQGDWPEGGDAGWSNNLKAAITGWTGQPAAPPFDADEPDRPALTTVSFADLPTPGVGDWHAMFEGQQWRFDAKGVYLRDAPTTPLRTPGAPTTVQKIVDLFSGQIRRASLAYGVAPELIAMTIATETGFAKNADFTGPKTFRWEPAVKVGDVPVPTFGDYSPGPMQTLATTARDVIRRMGLPYPDPFAIAPYIELQPSLAPATHPLYAADPNIDIGTAEIKTRWTKTVDDPILVAAAYNAGGLYRTDRNAWHLRSHADHLDRASKWYGDACFVISAMR
jgi:peptidoglycan L-alanyl-D-glutamate endopeptidase CwlK